MPILALIAALALASTPSAVASLQVPGDSLEAIRRVDFMLALRYREVGGRAPRRATSDALGQRFGRTCEADRGDLCFGDDPDLGRCPNFVMCHPRPRRLVEVLMESATGHPDSGYLTGQAVYLLGKLGRVAEALRVAEACRAASWWCEALRGYVLHGMGRGPEAYAAMRRAMRTAPDSVACAYTDATWVLDSWSQRGADTSVPDARERAAEWDCARRVAVSDSIWWLADPLYGTPGNDRWVEHVTRSLGARFREEIRHALPTSAGPRTVQNHLWAERVRRGQLDSYDTRVGTTWTGREAARYHFVPDLGADGLREPRWRLEAGLDDEGYTPELEPFVPLPHQIARFRADDAMHVAAATRVAGSPIAGALDATAAFVLTDGPDSAPLNLAAAARGPIVHFLGWAPARTYVASVEVVTTKGVGWARGMLEPLAGTGPEISDLLLYDADEATEPRDLRTAAAVMRGSTTVEQGARVGIYWEAYGAPAGATLRIEVAVERASGGLVERLRRLLPGGPEEGGGRITWTEPALDEPHRANVAVDLSDLEGGEYTLVLRVAWDGAPALERRRAFRVE